MACRTNDAFAAENEAHDVNEEEPRRGLLSWTLIVALLMGTGSGSALLWRTFGGGPILPSLTSVTISTASAEIWSDSRLISACCVPSNCCVD